MLNPLHLQRAFRFGHQTLSGDDDAEQNDYRMLDGAAD
jgi:hypothetical protein